MKLHYLSLKTKVIKLRGEGKTYSEINRILKKSFPKSTLSFWCKNVFLPLNYQKKIEEFNKFNLNKARTIALAVNKIKRSKHLNELFCRNKNLSETIKNKNVAKIALAMLYLGEGTKRHNGSLIFGNSDPLVIEIFLKFLRYCFSIDETKLRCTVQCRADQDIRKLERFWSNITEIPFSRFYRARIDPRTIGKPSKKLEYKGVCRIDYFSADTFIELMQIPKIIYDGPLA